MKAEIKTGDGWDEDNDNHVRLMGGDLMNPTWREYLDDFSSEWRAVMIAIARCVRKSWCWKITANKCCTIWFETDDGHTLKFSWRAWGDFMQALVNKREGYMTYYM